jgi:hypothetical protein
MFPGVFLPIRQRTAFLKQILKTIIDLNKYDNVIYVLGSVFYSVDISVFLKNGRFLRTEK